MKQARRSEVLGIALALLSVGTGCAEHEFLLSVRNPEPVNVVSSQEPVSRLPAKAPAGTLSAGQPFPDYGVLLQSGTEFGYFRDGSWLSSIHPVRIQDNGTRVSIDYTLHPGRRDLPLTLSLGRENVCELKTRDRPNRAMGYAGLALAITAGVITPITAVARDEGTRKAAPYVGAAAAAFLIAGAAFMLWPAGAEHVVIPPACNAPNPVP